MSSWTTTVPNSVRKSDPVGQTSRQAACVQCLQTSDDMSQRRSGTAWSVGPGAAPPDPAGDPSADAEDWDDREDWEPAERSLPANPPPTSAGSGAVRTD